MPKKQSPDLVEKVLELSETMTGYKTIAAAVGCSDATVCRILKKNYKNANGNKPQPK